jgi:hypothetical protein
MNRCSICHALVDEGSPSTSCPTCEQIYHDSCWNDLGGCATYGCQAAAAIDKPAPPAIVKGGWGDEKECPRCRKMIGSSLLRCPCGARFPWADPMTHAEYRDWTQGQSRMKGSRRTLLFLFLGSLPGVTAPVLGAIAGVYAARNRRLLTGTDGVYLAMGYGAAALGLTYALVIVALLLGA